MTSPFGKPAKRPRPRPVPQEFSLDEARRNLTRFFTTQALLLAAIVIMGVLVLQASPLLVAWIAVLPALFGGVTFLYYRRLKATAEAGGDRAALKAANAATVKHYGIALAVWAVGLAALLLFL